jgi:hypothetical protein
VTDPALRLLLEFLAAVVGLSLAWHIVVKNFVVASLLSGICVFISMGILNRDFEEPSLFSVAFDFAAYGVTAIIFSLAIGIPFNRRRNPLPPAEQPAGLKPVASWSQRLTWLQIVPIFVVILIFIIRRVFW